ncbi:MAG TPA: metal ABC transporter ATP-binding protein [Planctomycetota bacterium]
MSATPRPPLVRLSAAAFGYGARRIVEAVELELEAGRFLGIVGPNGAGKTTLFRGILGLVPPLAGTCRREPGVVFGYVPQRESLEATFPLSVREVVEMGAYHRLGRLRRPGAADLALVDEWIERVGLGARRTAPFAELSGGQRQRALLARALVTRPDVLLLDEPTSGVDRGAQEQILALLAELHRGGLAILLVSHQLALVRRFVEEVLVVADGRVWRGPPQELLAPERMELLFGAGAGAE